MGKIASAHAATGVGSIRAPEHAPDCGARHRSFSRFFRVAMRRQPSRVPETLTAPVHALRLLLVASRPRRLHVGGDAALLGGAGFLWQDARRSPRLVPGLVNGTGAWSRPVPVLRLLTTAARALSAQPGTHQWPWDSARGRWLRLGTPPVIGSYGRGVHLWHGICSAHPPGSIVPRGGHDEGG